MQKITERVESLVDVPTRYCPGCGHGVVHRLVAEVVDEMDLREKTILINPVGCSVFSNEYFDFDAVQPPHGRTPACATGVSRILSPKGHLVICYQGDGDLAAIGTAEIVHAANRGEKFTTIFVNNAIYGMTGGQMAPTTLLGQKSKTSPNGRDAVHAGMGYPIRVCELLAQLEGTRYLARGAVDTPANIRKTKKYIRTAFEAQMRGEGFTLVEIVAQCPTNWEMTPDQAIQWLKDNMLPFYQLGEVKNTLNEKGV